MEGLKIHYGKFTSAVSAAASAAKTNVVWGLKPDWIHWNCSHPQILLETWDFCMCWGRGWPCSLYLFFGVCGGCFSYLSLQRCGNSYNQAKNGLGFAKYCYKNATWVMSVFWMIFWLSATPTFHGMKCGKEGQSHQDIAWAWSSGKCPPCAGTHLEESCRFNWTSFSTSFPSVKVLRQGCAGRISVGQCWLCCHNLHTGKCAWSKDIITNLCSLIFINILKEK